MGCCVSKYDDHATPEERRANALAAAESRSKANEMRGIKTASMANKVRVNSTARQSASTLGDRKAEQMARDWAS
ncbi:unnamed product [Ostreococcus tauri]|uniref:Unnamed product n=1 Tax=Ostreococcus tauri TaxID=70448 RepID=A0A096PB15_OSTTA|nr:unnamed product [Ostreococcus tauri]CEG01800.1 unnamed product [Ostreococcus tauri]|eukprot:XP_022841177.1 unnamed product [Ostreococcus tauri]